MGNYICKRLGQTLVVLFLVSIGVFFLMDMLPGDPVYAIYGEEISQSEYDKAYLELGLNKPTIVRYVDWLKDSASGNFGMSSQSRVPVSELLAVRVPITIYLAVLSFVISMPLGILFGIISAVYRGRPIDTVVTLAANICACLPQFWVAILLLYVFSMKLGLLPSYGFTWFYDDFGKSMRQMAMPLFCLVLHGVAGTTRQTRSSMLEVIRQDYIRTARSKGLKERKVIYLHALKNGLIPVISVMGTRLAHLVGGSMFVESVFSIPGMGSLFVKSIVSRDIPVVQACVLLTSLVSCAAYIVTDILYVLVDPRIQYEK